MLGGRANADGRDCRIWMESILISCKLHKTWIGPKPVDERSDHDLFRTELANLIDRPPARTSQTGRADRLASVRRRVEPAVRKLDRAACAAHPIDGVFAVLKHVYALSDED